MGKPLAVSVSLIIVSYNTKNLLQRCFESIRNSAGPVTYETIVVDNGSRDGSAEYIKANYPEIILVESHENLGFGGANNVGLRYAKGQYVVLLNTDAFFVGNTLELAVQKMALNPRVGLAGARLAGDDGAAQPSARTYPGFWTELVTLTGLASRFPRSRIFGRPDLTYLDFEKEIYCDWVPGAFLIIRKEILDKIGFFDEAFFLYYEEVDLCRRIKKAGWKIVYWPDLRVIHIGGASTSVFSEKLVSKSGRQMGLWRLQSQYIYHRKHHGGMKAFLSKFIEQILNKMRIVKNRHGDPKKVEESQVVLDLIDRAWANTRGGRVSPPRPWQGV